MFKLGERQTLKCVSKAEFGIYLGENDREKVLLPKKQVSEGMEIGDEIDVFIYRDSLDRLISTTSQPYINLGGMAVLEVKSVSKIGAFLDWGLEKDLFLPFKEQTCMYPVKIATEILNNSGLIIEIEYNIIIDKITIRIIAIPDRNNIFFALFLAFRFINISSSK